MSLKEYIDVINKSQIFQNVSSDTIIEILNEIKFRIVHYDANSIIFDKDNICTTFNIVLDGIIEVHKKDKSGILFESILVKTSDIFGEGIFFDNSNIIAIDALAKENATILHIEKDAVLRLCHINQNVVNNFLELVCEENKQYVLKLFDNIWPRLTIRQKISKSLLYQYSLHGQLEIKMHMTKEEWAHMLGISRASLSRELMRMKKENIITFDRHTVVIKSIYSMKRILSIEGSQGHEEK